MPQNHPARSHAIHSRVRSFSRAGGRLTDGQARAWRSTAAAIS